MVQILFFSRRWHVVDTCVVPAYTKSSKVRPHFPRAAGVISCCERSLVAVITHSIGQGPTPTFSPSITHEGLHTPYDVMSAPTKMIESSTVQSHKYGRTQEAKSLGQSHGRAVLRWGVRKARSTVPLSYHARKIEEKIRFFVNPLRRKEKRPRTTEIT